MKIQQEFKRRYWYALLGVFVLIACAIVVVGFFYLSRLQAKARQSAYEELNAIADLKARQIVNWREERLATARFFYRAHFVGADVQKFLERPNSPSARGSVLNWLTLLKAAGQYSAAILYDAQLKPRLAIPASTGEPSPSLRALLDESLRSGRPVMTDLHLHEGNDQIHIDMLFPVFPSPAPFDATAGPRSSRDAPVIGAVLLKMDPREFLFPLIQSWPTPSQSAETLLVRREGDYVTYLNDLRHRQGTALSLRAPLNSPDLLAAKILRGAAGIVEGLDYQGVPVVGVGKAISGTPWTVVAKVDKQEIFAPLKKETAQVGGILGALLLAEAAFVLSLWRQRNMEFLQRELASERERLALAERVVNLTRYANDIIVMVDQDWQIVEANDRAIQAYGYNLAELRQMKATALRVPEARAVFAGQTEQLKRQGSILFETMHQRKDGTVFPVEVSGRMVKIGDAELMMGIVRDISERKAHEQELERVNRLYASLSQVNQAIVRARSQEELFLEICRVLVQFGGFEMAWIGWVDTATLAVTPVAQFGDYAGYLKEIHVFANDRPEGRGPIGTSIREGRACVCNDLVNDPCMLPWRLAAARSGWHSLAAFPVRQESVICAALGVYSVEAGYFGPKEKALLEEAALDISFGLDTQLNKARRQAAEKELRELNAILEQRVRERTADLETKNQELETFAYSVSHDLKAPVRSIEGFGNMFLDDYASSVEVDGIRCINSILKSAETMRQLIDDLLSYSRLELEKVTITTIDLRRLVESILEGYRGEIDAGKTELKVAISCAPLRTDASGLAQALRNLIGNALKFSAKAPQPVIEITARDQGELSVLEIRDNGIGFDMQYHEKIFEIFQRLHSNKNYPGTGIGLAIVRKAMQRIGGKVWAESEPGKGATFFIEIPRSGKESGA